MMALRQGLFMVDIDILKRRKITPQELKKVLAPDIKAPLPIGKEAEDKVKNLRLRLSNRITAGRDKNIANWKYFYALDKAWEIPFNQISATLLQSLMEKDVTDQKAAKEVQDVLRTWGFNPNNILKQIPDPKSPNKTMLSLDIPAFFTIFVPLVRAYTTIRWARIMNIRRMRPGFKYEPAFNNAMTRLQGDIITSRVGDVMYRQMGYWNVLKQSVFQMLHYSFAIQFPVEEWYREYQWGENDKETKKVEREGIRYHIPHPSRTFYDPAHRPSTFNTDTGCEYAGYWRVLPYRLIRENPNFWNTDKISVGATEWWSNPATVQYFNAIYNGCVLASAGHSSGYQGSGKPDDQSVLY